MLHLPPALNAATWLPRGFLLALLLWLVRHRPEPPLGGDLGVGVIVPGGEVEVLGVGRHSATVVFIHGLGANAAQLAPLVRRMRPHLWQVSFLLPSSPVRPLTARDGIRVPAWFDIHAFPKNRHAPLPTGGEDHAGMLAAVERIHRLVRDQVTRKGIDEDRIVLAGFSQGCATALLSALSYPARLGGVACLSGWLPLSDRIQRDRGNRTSHPLQSEYAHEMPVFWSHGTHDPVVLPTWAQESIGHLDRMGFRNVSFHSYPGMMHDVWRWDLERDLLAWLQQRLPPI
ncbi:hypothetical protein JCM8202_003312 [Rhodotorula sphaerocarpa]